MLWKYCSCNFRNLIKNVLLIFFEYFFKACFLNQNPSIDAYMPFIYCTESAQGTIDDIIQACATKLGIDLDKVLDCANSRQGNTLEYQMALLTEALNPPHKYVPWITLNGVHTEEIQEKAQNDLVGLLCQTYTVKIFDLNI